AVRRVRVEPRPVTAVVHQEPGCRPFARAGAATEVSTPLQHEHRHAGARQIRSDDRSVMTAAEDDRVVPGVAHRIVTVPESPSTRSRSPVRIRLVAVAVPTTAGRPYSRETIAAWDMIPPMSETAAAIFPNTGVQLGDVTGATRISPGSSSPSCARSSTTRAGPSTMPGDAAKPVSVEVVSP